ncbi:right-handed parallel beta-helix repeat-containing protein [Thalassotalea psychrophila]|uniref:Right-handed parallel beta-helix repeat-containing protein n=1 Tax=Thalassotalea psychrophila TaxID=3065647 RepID=A0ABY9TVH4_9GAMM|nr:right-handed parallel beta-helix repeat-containing protein [Colwelliaceae bacterium SQ149]
MKPYFSIRQLVSQCCLIAICTLIPNGQVFAQTYYVSPLGDNSNSGTSELQALQSVQQGINKMEAGDNLVVLDGIYTGTLKLKSGITIKAKNPRKVVFSGIEPLNAQFELYKGNIYKTEINPQIKDELKQLFYQGMPMTWARWPNASWQENRIHEKKWATVKDGTGPGVVKSDELAQFANKNLTNAQIFIRYAKGNSSYSRAIKSIKDDALLWDDKKFYSSKFTGEDGRKGSVEALKHKKFNNKDHIIHPNRTLFFLAGSLDLLDAPGEWFVKDNTLYFYPPKTADGQAPDLSKLFYKTTDYTFSEQQTISDLTIEGIDFLATSIQLPSENNRNITFRNSQFKYIGAELLFKDRMHVKKGADKPLYFAGTNINFDRCLFAGAQNSALKLRGSDLTVKNSVFMENNRHANFESRALLIENTGYYNITRNTFFNNGSDSIYLKSWYDLGKEKAPYSEVSYNHIFNGGKYNTDVSGFYMPSRSQGNAQVHHNWMHNVMYAYRLDLAGKDLALHHNVFWSSKRGMSVEGYENFSIYNNTAIHNLEPNEIIRNVMDHSNIKGSQELDFPPIEDWNVLNNLFAQFVDRIGPRERIKQLAQGRKGLLHPERAKSWLIPIVDRGAMQGNITGFDNSIFVNSDLNNLNLMPKANANINGGVKQSKALAEAGVLQLSSYRGAYDINGEYWYPGSDWMPNGLPVIKTMAEAEQFARKYSTISIVPETNL